ncbi:MAG: MaoC family protein/phosphate acetyl/butaryl transferase [Caulobacteraceae bacterium]|nr:MaoC family protein/phosphate acetyl/butaryl transferase [Caulobacteraceae bacterium]
MSWTFLEDLQIGQTVSLSRTITAGDIDAFAAVSGDYNPVHVDEEYARATQFGGRIAHGMLLGSFISAALASHLPGHGTVYVSQSLRFKRPVRIGDEVSTQVTIKEIEPRRGFVTLTTQCLVGGKVAVDGEAVAIMPKRPPA